MAGGKNLLTQTLDVLKLHCLSLQGRQRLLWQGNKKTWMSFLMLEVAILTATLKDSFV